jgi:hypothetical protein
MLKILTQHSRLRIYVIYGVVGVIIFLVGGAAGWFVRRATAPTKTETSTPSAAAIDAANKQNDRPDPKLAPASIAPAASPTPSHLASPEQATITKLAQENGSILFTATVPDSSSSGTCVITFASENSRPVVKQVSSTNKDGSSLCGPLAIPEYEFSYLGEWTVSLQYTSQSAQATVGGRITIK